MHKAKRNITNKINKARNIILLSFVTYIIGVIIGVFNVDKTFFDIDVFYNYEYTERIFRCSFYAIIVFLFSNSSFGILVIIYLIYIYGVNNGVISSLFFSFSKEYLNDFHIFVMFSVLSSFATIIIGTSSMYLSKEIFLNIFSGKRSRILNTLINSLILILIGFSFYYFADLYKLKLLESIK